MEDGENYCEIDHGGRRARFSMSILRIHRTPLVRKVNEAVRIIISSAKCIMNSKTEFQGMNIRVGRRKHNKKISKLFFNLKIKLKFLRTLFDLTFLISNIIMRRTYNIKI